MYELCVGRRWDDITGCIEGGEWKANDPLVDPELGNKFLLLVCAAQQGLISLAETLLRKGADASSRYSGGPSVLMVASGAGHEGVVDILIQAGAKVHAKWRGETALMSAAEGDHKNVIRKLLKAGASVMDQDGKGRTALSCAATRGKIAPETISLLVEAGSPVDGRDLHVPIALRELEVVRLLLTRQPHVNARFDWPSFGGAPITKGDTPLLVAAGDTMEETLIKAGSPFSHLKPTERLAIVDLLIAAGADVNAQRLKTGATPLILATSSDEAEVAERLIRAGADPHQEFECKLVRFPFSKPRTLTSKTLSAVRLAEMRPRNKRIRKLLGVEDGSTESSH